MSATATNRPKRLGPDNKLARTLGLMKEFSEKLLDSDYVGAFQPDRDSWTAFGEQLRELARIASAQLEHVVKDDLLRIELKLRLIEFERTLKNYRFLTQN